MNKLKALCVIAISSFIVTNSIGTASALDVGDPDISVKILAPDEFMPDSTYFIGVKYIVNATFWGADPAIDPEIVFTVENAEIIEKLSGRFDAVNTSQGCNFSLNGEIAEKRNENVVVIIKTASSGNVNMDVTARAHDSDNYGNIITATDSISVPVRELNPNSVEYFRELAEQRKTLFEQYLYLVNETLMGTTSEVMKMNDEAMQTALFKTTSACYKMTLDELISSGAGSFLDPITGIAGTYEYMDFTNEAINGFEGNPLFASVNWIFNWCDYVIDKMELDMAIRTLFGHGFTGPEDYLNQYISLINEEIECWDNNDFNGLKNVLDEQKGFWKYKDDYLRVSNGIAEYDSLPEDTRTYVRLLYGSIGKSIDSDCRLINEYIEPATQEPKTGFISAPGNNIDLRNGDEYELVFKIKNDGGTATDSYFSLSISDGLNITDNSSDKPNGKFSIYHKSDLIWYHDEYQIPANYTLLDWHRPWLGAGEEQTLKIKIKGTQNGDQWVKYRLAFKPLLEGLSFVRDPTSGELDQQGWHAYKIDVNVSDISNHKPNADFSYTVNNMSVEFTSLSTDPDGDPLDYYWDFDDGSTSAEENPTHEYENAGDYSVTLTVTDTHGLNDYKTKKIHVNEKPKADFVYFANKTNVTFFSTSTDDGSIVSWDWKFGDGETGTGETVSHSYSLEGIYNVTLTVTDNDGATDTVVKEIGAVSTIFISGEDAKYEANLSMVSIPTNPAPIKTIFVSNADASSYRNLSSVSIPTQPSPIKGIFISGEDAKYKANLSMVSISTNPAPIKTIFISNADASSYRNLSGVSIPTQPSPITEIFISNADVAFNRNLSNILTQPPIENQPPIASFTYIPENPLVDEQITFDASASTDPDGTIVKYEWDFGDGNVTNTTHEILNHSYSEAGSYEVTLTVTDDKEATNSTTKIITVYSPTAIFDIGRPENPYPSISGEFVGMIRTNTTIIATRLYTYACEGTGGHTEHALIWNKTWCAEAKWEGYKGDWMNISFNKTVVLMPYETYNITIVTGSYPQIHHTHSLKTENGWINCTEFIDANGKKYEDWIPAIMLWS